MVNVSPDQAIRFVKWLLGGLAVVAAFLLVQDDVVIGPVVKVALGAFLAFAAYVDPATLANKLRGDG